MLSPLPDARRAAARPEAVDEDELRLGGGGGWAPIVDGGVAVDVCRLGGEARRRDGAAEEKAGDRYDTETGGDHYR